MKIYITGLSHKTAPVEVRERLAFGDQNLPQALTSLREQPGVREGMILSTCNRVEIAIASDGDTDPGPQLADFLADTRQVERSWVRPFLYRLEEREAIRHLFRVASSLDSMIVGEPQILGQLKSAYALAKAHGTISGFLELLCSRAFNVAKRIRSDTDLGENAVSVSYSAVELAREIFGSLDECRVLVAGAGKMAESAVRYLRRAGVTQVFVTNRTRERAERLAADHGGAVIPYEEFLSRLPEVDIVIASSGAPHFILTRDDMRKVMGARRNRPMFLIDIAVPRNIEPAVNRVDGVFLYDIDDLQKVVDQNLHGRRTVAAEAEQIIEEEVERMIARLKAREVSPAIVSIQEQLELWRVAELDKARGRLGSLTPQQMEAVEALTRGLVNKVAHGPISLLRKSAEKGDAEMLSVVRRLFRLE
ncbi:MAG: glutamyl-tRNA reductase [Bryobacteraceae bacterium]